MKKYDFQNPPKIPLPETDHVLIRILLKNVIWRYLVFKMMGH